MPGQRAKVKITKNESIKKFEKVQERALRFVCEDYNSSYEELLQKAKVPSLQIRRMRTMALHAEQRHLDPFQDCKRLLNWEKLFSVLK
jgi:hypothetical protein